MKRLIILFLFLAAGLLTAQDVIYKADGTEIQSKVTEITPEFIKYKKFSNLDGPTYNVSITEVFMIVYENGEREVFKKSDTPAPPPAPKVQQPVKQQPKETVTPAPPPPAAQQPVQQQPAYTQQSYNTNNQGFQHTGLYAGFLVGVAMPQGMKLEEKIGEFPEAKADVDKDMDSDFKFVAHAAWQTDNMAFLIGGTVQSASINGNTLLSMSYWGVGLNYYFSLDKFSPYAFIRAAYGFGSFDKDFKDLKDVSLSGYNLGFGPGFKFYLDDSWGIAAEIGYQISSQSVDEKVKDRFDKEYNYEFTHDMNAFSIVAGFFFYP